MDRSIRGAVLVSLASTFLLSACEPSPPAGEAEAYHRETTAFCADVGVYATTYEDRDLAGGGWPEWHSSASSLVEALDKWEAKRPDALPADVGASIDRYFDSFVARLRGLENVQALRADCAEVVAGLEQYVETLR
jgi:hypothetical protein